MAQLQDLEEQLNQIRARNDVLEKKQNRSVLLKRVLHDGFRFDEDMAVLKEQVAVERTKRETIENEKDELKGLVHRKTTDLQVLLAACQKCNYGCRHRNQKLSNSEQWWLAFAGRRRSGILKAETKKLYRYRKSRGTSNRKYRLRYIFHSEKGYGYSGCGVERAGRSEPRAAAERDPVGDEQRESQDGPE